MKLTNKQARLLWLATNGLLAPPTGALDVLGIVKCLGFVQLDTIQNITRAHHHILWSRNQNYREGGLERLLAQDRSVFEHFTHDASVLPVDLYPMWQWQYARMGAKVRSHAWYGTSLSTQAVDDIMARIRTEGALSTRNFDTKVPEDKREMWARPPHKKALDALWYAGDLTTSHRENFIKFYDLPERVIPSAHFGAQHSGADQLDHLCKQALHRLTFGALGDIQRFWDAASASEVKAWADENTDVLRPIEIEAHDGAVMSVFAVTDLQARLNALTAPSNRMRIINPFDPAVRDRKRLERLFGFAYTNEMFVPKTKRKWGYYVYPLLEGDRFVGRMEATADRKAGTLKVLNLWPEPGVKWSDARHSRLEAELSRMATFIGVPDVQFVRPAPLAPKA